MTMTSDPLFSVAGKKIAITGGAGVLCSSMAKALVQRGAKVALLDMAMDRLEAVVADLNKVGGEGCAYAVAANILSEEKVREACKQSCDQLGGLDILINGAGGNKPAATAGPTNSFFQIPADALRQVFDLNCIGTILPSQVFGEVMAKQKTGGIINVSSMAAFRPLTNVIGYSAAKAAISNFTMWLAVYMGQNVSPNIRVNAIAPGFFITDQNRYLLTVKETGDLTPRGNAVINHTPMKRFGDPEDLNGALIYLISDASKFVTGTVMAVDGGFNAFAGV